MYLRKIALGVLMSTVSTLGVAADERKEAFGLTDGQFQELFEGSTLPAVNGFESVPDFVKELRVFLTEEPDIVRGEIVLNGTRNFKSFPINLEKGAVTFERSGETKDGLAVFSAKFPMDTAAELNSVRPTLEVQLDAASKDNAQILISPRNVIPARTLNKILEEEKQGDFELTAENERFLAAIQEIEHPFELAQQVGINIEEVPFLRIQGPASEQLVRFDRVFDRPVFDFIGGGLRSSINRDASLMVKDVGVVEDNARTFDVCTGIGTEGGAWSFGHLMRELSKDSTLSPEDYALYWIEHWNQNFLGVNGQNIADSSRSTDGIIDLWRALSGGTNLDIDKFPATLTAIVSRPDLADSVGYGSAGSAGEGRFVFALHAQGSGGGTQCEAIPFTVILEYEIEGGSCSSVKNWYQRWKDLDMHALGSPAYNAALEDITRDFTDFSASRMGQLSQLRTNENALGNITWQLLEFRQNPNNDNLLDLDTVKQTPIGALNSGPVLQSWMEANQNALFTGTHVVPLRYPNPGAPFMAAKADVNLPRGIWDNQITGALDPGKEGTIRRNLSLQTCNGCHSNETDTFFTHIGTDFSPALGHRSMGSSVSLSKFLTGNPTDSPYMDDPDNSTGSNIGYADLAQREDKMSKILNRSCFVLSAQKATFVH